MPFKTIFLTLLILWGHSLFAYDPIQYERGVLEYLNQQYKEKKYDINLLQEIKFNLINGNIQQAKKNLKDYKNKGKLILIPDFYQSIIYFLEGDYSKSNQVIKYKLQSYFNGHSRSCMLYLYNKLQLGNFDNIDKDLYKCMSSNSKWSPSNYFWANILIKKITNDSFLFKENKLNKLFVNYDDIEENIWALWLKMSLYYGQEKEFQFLLEKIPPNLFKSARIKELLGFLYYRLKDIDLAKDFFNDISTVNSEVAMANIYIQEGKYELALGHLLVALKLKSNSINTVNRLALLYWKLGDYQKGYQIAEKFPVNKNEGTQKILMTMPFYLKEKKFKRVISKFTTLKKVYGDDLPLKSLQTSVIAFLMENQMKNYKKYAESLCLKLDLIGCYQYGWSQIWEDLPKMIKQKTVVDLDEKELSLREVIHSKKREPIPDISYIRQIDIEELDESLYETGL